ncbi:Ig-like domain-containing protein [Herbaspirillum sp. HC18]|nr:Ig-like domain-containing protein [Herbaspirillum sp. HC18]
MAGCGGGDLSGTDLLRSNCAAGVKGACEQLAAASGTTTTSSVGTTSGTTTTVSAPSLTLKPKELTLGDCTTNIPFFFSGGKPPYTIFTTDNFRIPVSSAQSLGSDYFFLASVGPLIGRTPEGKYLSEYPPATLTVLDSEQRTATATLKFPVIHLTCPDNPILLTTPASANAHVTEILAFQVGGGDGTFSAASSNDQVATVVDQGADAFKVQAKAVGTALITVSSGDGQKANVVFTVLPLQ